MWLKATAPDGRILMPITAMLPGFGIIGKGPMIVAAANARVGQALKKSPFALLPAFISSCAFFFWV